MLQLLKTKNLLVQINLILFLVIIPCFFSVNLFGKTVYIDSGHSLVNKGAEGIHAVEVLYNDALVKRIYKDLRSSKENLILYTRLKNSKIFLFNKRPTYMNFLTDIKWANDYKIRELYSRSHIANLKKADIFISIHHDSVVEEYLKSNYLSIHPKLRDTSLKFKNKFKPGFSIFVSSYNLNKQDKNSKTNLRFKKSIRLAEIIAKALIGIGRLPSNYHHEIRLDKSESYVLLNKSLGIYDSKLAVLKSTKMPSVLIEVGVIVDRTDEKVINTKNFKSNFSKSLKKSIETYFKIVN